MAKLISTETGKIMKMDLVTFKEIFGLVGRQYFLTQNHTTPHPTTPPRTQISPLIDQKRIRIADCDDES